MNRPPSQNNRRSLKHIQKTSSRNVVRLETIACCPQAPSTLATPPLPHKKQHSELYRGQNSQSSYLKRVKIGSVRLKNETDCWPKNKQKEERWVPQAPSFFQNNTKKQDVSIDAKGRSSRSYIIRQKNNSNYSKKQTEEPHRREAQSVHKMGRGQALNHSKQFDREQPGKTSQNETKIKERKPKSVYTIQHSQEDRKALKTRLIVCRQPKPKQITNIFQNITESEFHTSVPSIQKITTDNFQEREKIQVPSEQSVETNQSSQINPQLRKQREPSYYSREDKENKHHKHRTYTGCKTIRVPWQTQGTYFNQLQNMQTKKPKEPELTIQLAPPPLIEEQPFGGISMIPKPQQLSRKNSARLQSLQQLFMELQEKESTESTELKSQDLIQ